MERKQTPIGLYLMVPHQVREGGKKVTKFCQLSCKKIKSFEGFLPTKEILETHFQAERVRIEIAKKNGEEYTPQPLYLEFEEETFNAILEEAQAKDKMLAGANVFALTLGTPVPCCIISKRNSQE